MEEKTVTIDGVGRPLSELFTVVATQNPIEYEGTYRLPEAQLDRFLLKLEISYPPPQEEDRILRLYQGRAVSARRSTSSARPLRRWSRRPLVGRF